MGLFLFTEASGNKYQIIVGVRFKSLFRSHQARTYIEMGWPAQLEVSVWSEFERSASVVDDDALRSAIPACVDHVLLLQKVFIQILTLRYTCVSYKGLCSKDLRSYAAFLRSWGTVKFTS